MRRAFPVAAVAALALVGMVGVVLQQGAGATAETTAREVTGATLT